MSAISRRKLFGFAAALPLVGLGVGAASAAKVVAKSYVLDLRFAPGVDLPLVTSAEAAAAQAMATIVADVPLAVAGEGGLPDWAVALQVEA